MFLVESKTEVPAGLVEISRQGSQEVADPDLDPRTASYYELRDRIIQERDAGNLPEALQLCDEALVLATKIGDVTLTEQAYCNRFGFALALGHTDDLSYSRLREILMRNRNLRTSYTAAYNLACGYTTKKEHKKALFYAQIARDRAYALKDVGPIVQSHNEIGRCYLSESYFDKAVTECETALEILPAEQSYAHTAPLINLGYAKILLRDYRAGFKHLYRSLRYCRSHSSERAYQELIHLYLCSGHIELRRWRYAWHHGCRALEMAQNNGNLDVEKNALYLLGEVEKSVGDIEAAYDYFSRLQRQFYPENKELATMMLYCETRELINLRA